MLDAVDTTKAYTGRLVLARELDNATLKAGVQYDRRTKIADERQITFEIHALILALHYDARFLQQPGATQRAVRGFNNILARYGA